MNDEQYLIYKSSNLYDLENLLNGRIFKIVKIWKFVDQILLIVHRAIIHFSFTTLTATSQS